MDCIAVSWLCYNTSHCLARGQTDVEQMTSMLATPSTIVSVELHSGPVALLQLLRFLARRHANMKQGHITVYRRPAFDIYCA